MEKPITMEEVIEAKNKLFLDQLVSNVDMLDQLLHDDLIAVSPTGQMTTKEKNLDSSHKNNGH